MPEITAASVKSLRELTGLPMMECKRALQETGGDTEKAVELLRKEGKKTMEKRSGRTTTAGRVSVFAEASPAVGAMVDLRCESAPVANHEEFGQLATDLVRQLATGPGAATPEELLGQPSPSQPGTTLARQFEDLNHRIREVFKVERMVRLDGACAGYAHHNGAVGVVLQYEGGNPTLGRDICMHIAAMRPAVVSPADLPAEEVQKEREILAAAARNEGKPEKIIEKMVEGRLHSYYAERCLSEQPFVKDDKQSVGQVAKAAGMKLVRFVHWELPKE
jgi:elongation factor Ts